jgi:hypothetical protein
VVHSLSREAPTIVQAGTIVGVSLSLKQAIGHQRVQEPMLGGQLVVYPKYSH